MKKARFLSGAIGALAIALVIGVAGGEEMKAVVVQGRVRGEPRVDADVSHAAYGDRALQYAPRFDYDRLKNVAVYAETPGGPAAAAGPEGLLTLASSGRGFSAAPSFQAVPAGSIVTFRNTSGSALSLYASGDSADEWDLDIAPGADARASFPSSGIYHLRCRQEPAWQAEILSAGTAVALADADGHYHLSLLPGHYRLTAWHPRLPPQSQELDVRSGPPQKMDFTLSVKQLPEVH